MSVYCACVDFLLVVSAALGISYSDANALLFFVLWPALTLLLLVVVVVQGRALRQRRARLRA